MFTVVVHICSLSHYLYVAQANKVFSASYGAVKNRQCGHRVKAGSAVKVTSSAVSQMARMQSSGPLQCATCFIYLYIFLE